MSFIRICLAAAILLIALQAANAATLLRCKAKDAVALQDDGTLSMDERAKGQMHTWLIDISSGMVRITLGSSEIGPMKYFVAKRGDKANDTVLVRPGDGFYGVFQEGKTRDDIVEAATDFFRIRQWEDMTNILFQHYNLGSLASGTCEPVR